MLNKLNKKTKGELEMVSTSNNPEMERDVIMEAVEVCKPYLKYFPGFSTVGQIMNESATTIGYYEFITDERVIDFPEGIDLKTKCVEIECFGRDFVLDREKNNGDGLRTERTLLLTEKGILLERFYRYYVLQGIPIPGKTNRGKRNVALECQFSIVDNQRMLRLLKEHRGFFTKRILDELSELTNRGIKERTDRLKKMRQVKTLLKKIQDALA